MIYETLLAENFSKLHPKLQERYRLPLNEEFFASGMMHTICSGPKLLRPLYQLFTKNRFLFPEGGTNIPFTISNKSYLNDEQQAEVYWERTFYFPDATRKFNATMTVDLKRKVVKDYLGDPSIFYSDLQFDVTKDGFLLIRSKEQRVVIGRAEFGLPRLLTGRVTVTEGFDDVQNVYTIHVSIFNDVMGRMMLYAGTFTQSAH
ncbi:MAG: DUF4166 domain-containing protein [Lysinibacillus sp.]